jgi:CO dehydrogenase maturation factor
MIAQSLGLGGRKIGVLGKGGAGKSTCVVLLAHALSEFGYDVCVLDADSTNIGLHLALGIARLPRSLIDYFGGMVFLGGSVGCPADDPALLPDAEVALEDLPREYQARTENGIVLLGVGKLSEFGVGAGCDGPLIKIARDLVVTEQGRPMVMLVDLKAGIEDTSRGVLVGMDQIIVVTDPSTASVGMAVAVKQMVEELWKGAEPATEHLENAELADLARRLFRQGKLRRVHVVLNNVPDEESRRFVISKLEPHGLPPAAVIPQDTSLGAAWMRGDALPTGQFTDCLAPLVGAIRPIVSRRARLRSSDHERTTVP